MKPKPLKIQLKPEHSFNVRHDVVPFFYNKLHYHPELELVHILKGSGRQFIGDNVSHFQAGDMVLVGDDLPHLWRSDEKYLQHNQKLTCEAIVIHFTKECLGKTFFYLPETKKILAVLKKAKQGLRITGKTRMKVGSLMKTINTATPAKRLLIFLEILLIIAESTDCKSICMKKTDFDFSPVDSEKINAVYQYILQNYSRPLTLHQIAALAHLTPSSFCRYFKSRVNKSFSKFLIEIRIGHACRLLTETDNTVSAICYESGYNNFSNFNKHFKLITGTTPLAYRRQYIENNVAG